MSASSIKTVLLLAVLGAVGYGVYCKLHGNGSESIAPPVGVERWSGPPKIELPAAASSVPAFPSIPTQPSYPARAELNTASGQPAADPFSSGNGTRVPGPSADSAGTLGVPPSQERPDRNTLRPMEQGPAAAGDRPDEQVRKAFAAMMESALAELSKGKLAEVHLTLSEWYGDPRLPLDQARQLSELLSQLAGTVIYSRQHLLERAYVVQYGDTLEKIGQAYNVPWQLLAKINGISSPNDVRPGQELKVVRGPFNAIVDLGRYELVLILDGRYAGRFPIGVGRDCPTLERQYVVRGKTLNPAADGNGPTEDPGKLVGSRWIDLGGGLGIHGTNAPQNLGHTEGRGAVFLAERDLEDLYDILTVGSNGSNGSNVIVRR